MRSEKLRKLLLNIEFGENDSPEIVNLNEELSSKLIGVFGLSNGSCNNNGVCSNNTTCNNNPTCSGNGTCGKHDI